jgi:transglutaminase-like putative cysteine protease
VWRPAISPRELFGADLSSESPAGPGWLDFDPASGIVGNRDLIRVAAVRVPCQAIPLHGTWTGFPSDYLEMTVEVKVTAADAEGANRPARTCSGMVL